ncbi:MAG: DUF433 domain-containing protein [Blastocatellia bacterium]
MIATATKNQTVTRTERGLVVKGSRLTLYQIKDYLLANYSRQMILEYHPWLSAEQLDDVLNYIETNREEFEVEYREVVEYDEEIRRYWEERNRERISQFNPDTLSPERRAVWDKLQAWREEIESRDYSAD